MREVHICIFDIWRAMVLIWRSMLLSGWVGRRHVSTSKAVSDDEMMRWARALLNATWQDDLL